MTKIQILGEFSIKTDWDSYCWSTSELDLAQAADWHNIRVGDEFWLVIGNQRILLTVTRRSRNQQNAKRPRYVIAAASPTWKLAQEKNYEKTFGSIFAHDAVCDILGREVDWQIVNWLIPAGKLAFYVSSRMEAALKIIAAVKGTCQTQLDGGILVVRRYPIPPAHWENALPNRVIDADLSELSYSESFANSNTYNAVTVGWEDSSKLSCEIETEINVAGRGIVRLIPIPFREMELAHTGGATVTISPGVERTIAKCELVTFQNGKATTTKPVYQLQTVKWQHTKLNLEPIQIETKELFASGGISGHSLAKILYTFRCIEFSVVCPTTTQFLAIEKEA